MKKFTLHFVVVVFSLLLFVPFLTAGGGTPPPPPPPKLPILNGVQVGDRDPNTYSIKSVNILQGKGTTIQTYSIYYSLDTSQTFPSPGLPNGLVVKSTDESIVKVLPPLPRVADTVPAQTGAIQIIAVNPGMATLYVESSKGKMLLHDRPVITVYNSTDQIDFQNSAGVIFSKPRVEPNHSLNFVLLLDRDTFSDDGFVLKTKRVDPDGRTTAIADQVFDYGGIAGGNEFWFYMGSVPPETPAGSKYWFDVKFQTGKGKTLVRSIFPVVVAPYGKTGLLGLPDLSSVYVYSHCCVSPHPNKMGFQGLFPAQNGGGVKVYMDRKLINPVISADVLRNYLEQYQNFFISLGLNATDFPVRERSFVLFFPGTGISMSLEGELVLDYNPAQVEFDPFGLFSTKGNEGDDEAFIAFKAAEVARQKGYKTQ